MWFNKIINPNSIRPQGPSSALGPQMQEPGRNIEAITTAWGQPMAAGKWRLVAPAVDGGGVGQGCPCLGGAAKHVFQLMAHRHRWLGTFTSMCMPQLGPTGHRHPSSTAPARDPSWACVAASACDWQALGAQLVLRGVELHLYLSVPGWRLVWPPCLCTVPTMDPMFQP